MAFMCRQAIRLLNGGVIFGGEQSASFVEEVIRISLNDYPGYPIAFYRDRYDGFLNGYLSRPY